MWRMTFSTNETGGTSQQVSPTQLNARESSNRNWEKLEFFFFFNWKSNQLNSDPDKRLLHENSYL